jgi:ubiquitin-like 1-activating enzyme E1 B
LFGKENDSNAITSFEAMKKDSNFSVSIFEKVFYHDVVELTKLKSNSVWQNGEPQGLTIPKDLEVTPSNELQKIWDLKENISYFLSSCVKLKDRREKNQDILEFDKDDEDALDFVTSVANLRAFNFHINRNSRFEIKALAGNIVNFSNFI